MSNQFTGIAIAIGGVLVNLGIAIVGGLWVLGSYREELVKYIHGQIDSLSEKFEKFDNQCVRMSGDAMAALRQKQTDTELWNRDHFVDKETFNAMLDRLGRFEDRLDQRLDRLESKIDRESSH